MSSSGRMATLLSDEVVLPHEHEGGGCRLCRTQALLLTGDSEGKGWLPHDMWRRRRTGKEWGWRQREVKMNATGQGWPYLMRPLLSPSDSPETIGRRAAVAIGICLAILLLTIWGFKIRRSWKRIRSQQGLQENSSGQSFFVRNKKIRRPPLSEGPQSLGCYNPVMEDGVSYATLQFPETSTPRTGDAGISERQGPPANRNDTVTYSVLQKPRVVDYENVTPNFPEDEEIHYSELVQFGVGERPRTQESVEYVTLKH